MKVKYLLFVPMVTSFAACEWVLPKKEAPRITKDTLTYTYKIFKQRSPDCGNKPDSNCTAVNFRYPVFKGKKNLNDSLIRKLSFFADVSFTSVEEMAKRMFIADRGYRNKSKKNNTYFSLDERVNIIRQDSSLITLEVNADVSYDVSEHYTFKIFLNWNTKADKGISLNDLFIEGYQGKLKTIAEGIFRKNEKLVDNASLAKDYFFKGGNFSLNENYSITPLGIRFLYLEGEIKPEAAGQTELFIPYGQIKQLLRPNTVVKQYIK